MYDLDDRNEQRSATIRSIFIILTISIIAVLIYCGILIPFYIYPGTNTNTVNSAFIISSRFFESVEVRCTMITIGLACLVVLILMIALPF